MTPQTTAQWADQMASLDWLRRQFEKTWTNTVFAFEVGGRAAMPLAHDGRQPR